ncbi:MAG: hypothetical protein LBM16_04105 [Clostridiales bacterium]|nr:hypothetical protein [Clostridiales bacterium]
MKDYLYEARNVLGVDTKLLIGERPDDGLRFNFDWYDISAFAAETGYKPYVSFPQAVKNLSEWVSSMQA